MRNQRGAAMVELALVMPLLLMLLMGVVDLGRAFAARIAVQDASQEGALVAAFMPDQTSRIVGQAVDAGASLPVAAADITITCDVSPDRITVRVTHDLDLITPFLQGMLGGQIQLVGTETATVFSADHDCVASP